MVKENKISTVVGITALTGSMLDRLLEKKASRKSWLEANIKAEFIEKFGQTEYNNARRDWVNKFLGDESEGNI